MYPYITVLDKVLPTYGVLGVLGVLLGLGLALLRCKRFALSRDDCLYIYVFSCLFAMLGAKVLYLLTVLPQLVADLPLMTQQPEAFFARYISGGMVFYGGLIGAVLGAFGTARFFRLRLENFFPVLVPAIPFVHAVGRVGCFMGGCCYGIEMPEPLGIAFTNALAAPNGVPLLPIQLIEAGAELILCVVLIICSNRKVRPRRLLGVYFLAYAPIRFALEFFRGDAGRGALGALSTSQWISIAILIAGLACCLPKRKEKNTLPS